jgi:rhamnose transport system substrate-binding protein
MYKQMPIHTHRIVALAVVFAALLAGCSTKSAEGGESSTGGQASSGGKTKLVFIPKKTGIGYFNQVGKGFAGAKDLDFDTQAPATADPTSQLPVIKDQVQRGVDVIVISSNSPDALNEELDKATAKGVTVLTVDADLTGNESHRVVGILPTDFSKIGTGQLELLGKLTNYQGEFAILSATTEAPNQNAWIAGIKEALKDPKYSKMKLVDVVYGDDDPQKSSTETEALLSKHPSLRGIIAPTTAGLPAAAQVIENAGVYPGGPKATNGGVVLTGLGMPNEMKKMVDKGVVTSFQLWDPADMGSIAAYLGGQLHSKKLTLKPGDTVDVPGHGKLTVGPNNVIFAGPLLTFDKNNIAKYDF